MYRSARPLDKFLDATSRFMMRYQPHGSGPVQLFSKESGVSRFDYFSVSEWDSKQFMNVFKNGAMPTSSARIEQVGGYLLVDNKGNPEIAQPQGNRYFLFFKDSLTEEGMRPLMENVASWRMYKAVNRNCLYTFIWEGVLDSSNPEMEALVTRDEGLYRSIGVVAELTIDQDSEPLVSTS